MRVICGHIISSLCENTPSMGADDAEMHSTCDSNQVNRTHFWADCWQGVFSPIKLWVLDEVEIFH